MHDSINLSLNSQSFDTKVYRIFDPEWQTETLHWFGNKDVPKEEKEQFIQALISFEDKCGDFYYYRAYLFAAEAIAYFPESRLGDVIVEQVLKWGYAYFRSLKQDWKILPQPLVISAREVISKTDKQRVVGAYTQLLHSTESRSVLRVAAKHLAKLAPGNSTAIAALVLLLKFCLNQNTIYSLVQLIQNCESQNSESFQEKLVTEHCNYLFYRNYMQNNSNVWGKIFQSHELKQTVIALKQCLVRQLWEKDFERYDIAYNIIWNCAQNMTYSEFYLAWYS
jgi:hypothetical protein